jgi:CMP-N-acetylneuraminic acid synthetase
MKVVAFVPIKLKSQRLKNKMLLPLGNKVLCQIIFETLINVKKQFNDSIDIYCFCSDPKIKQFLPDGINFLERDQSLDRNETKGLDIYKSFVNKVEADTYILCHATSPFIKEKSILTGINKVLNEGYDSAFSVSEVKTFCWFKNNPLNYSFTNVVRTQDIEPIFWETSAFYIFKKDVIDQERRIGNNSFMVKTDRIESIDIDEKEDYDLAFKLSQ